MFYFLRRTAVLILRPGIECCPAAAAVKVVLFDPILKVGGAAKLKPLPGALGWGAMEGVAEGAGDPPGAPPKANTPVLLLEVPNTLAPPNWKHPPDVVGADEPKAGVELAWWPNTGTELGLAPKAGGWEAVAEKGDGAGEPNAGALGWEVP